MSHPSRACMPRPVHAIALALLLVGGSLTPTRAADGPAPATAIALTRIMQDLGTGMQGVAGAIAREDWPAAARLATHIADHPQPPLTEKLRILAFVGTDAGRFRGYDQQARAAAQQLTQAAQRQDGVAVIAAFAKLQGDCLGCHQNFRRAFQAHFHGLPRSP